MRMRVLLATGALAAIVPALAAAQQRPATPLTRPQPAAQLAAHRERSFELSVGGGIFSVDRALNTYLDARNIVDPDPGRFMFGGVGRIGYNFTEKLGVSLGSGFGVGNGASLLSPFAALTYTLDLNKQMSPFLTVGAGWTTFYGNDTRVSADYGVHAGLGVRSMLGENLALRLEGRMAYEPYAAEEWGGLNAYNGTASLGLSYFMGGGPPRDTDADGVRDSRDRCPSTPTGATVDLTGCPSDTDRDGVYNGLDRCPNTPPNTPVTADGCTRDTDNDGIADNLDRCANTASGVPVDANGCPRDTDNDGVTDNLDRCANTPANARPVDASGCPVDTDRDAVPDYLDTCPNTAAGTQVDASGCPVARDADRDGVIDANDRCPNTPAGRIVDANGCPLAEVPAVGRSMVMRDVYFLVGGSGLAPATMTYLDGVAAAIKALPNSRWEIGGFTSSPGTVALNMRLSRQRAAAVVAYIVSKGVPASQLTAVGYGPTNFLAPNTTAAGRAQNRRVEMKRLQ